MVTKISGRFGYSWCNWCLPSAFLIFFLLLLLQQAPAENDNAATGRNTKNLPLGVIPLPALYHHSVQRDTTTNDKDNSNCPDDNILHLGDHAEFSFQLATGSATSDILTRALARFGALLPAPSTTNTRRGIKRTRATKNTHHENPHSTVWNTTENASHSCHRRQTLEACHVLVASANTDLHQDTNESYTLQIHNQLLSPNQLGINSGPSCLITSPTVYGAMYAMETFVQLVSHEYHRAVDLDNNNNNNNNNNNVQVSRTVPNDIFVADQPRFLVRSTMIDTARHWLPVDEVILPHIDAMAAAKMNLLHWHMVDSESWPYVSKAFPQLSIHGAYHPHQVYSADDIKRVAAYAKYRGIRVIPEIDSPGHLWAGLTALDPPVLTECYDKDGNVLGLGPMNPAKETTFSFLKTLLAEVVPLFGSNMFMIGGDEVDHTCWASNPDVAQFVKTQGWGTDMSKLHDYYNQRLLKLLAAQNTSSIMVWEEVFHSHERNGLPKDATMVNVWMAGWEWCTRAVSSSTADRSNTSCAYNYGNGGPWFGKMHVRDFSWTHTMGKAATAGYKTVLSSPFYLNVHNAGSNFDEAWPYLYAIEPTAFEAKRLPWQSSSIQERELVGEKDEVNFLTAQEREASVLGVQACMWTEWTNHANFLSRFWPATAAVAERGWSTQETVSIDDFRRRLFRFACELQRRGIPAEPAVFAGGFFYPNGTVCYPRGGAIGPSLTASGHTADACLPRFSSCGSLM